ncbi:hypothetical protein BRADI_2g14990v3 [Brachypodium distachyon]|uniref:Uncharacterized protein n=1 Tax=Brachypodium distachyon TaxID=15368 RepID=A0A2K2D8P7_BRADI|nr:hypothetical protein BRADI_2g14990v3 [Brachypodium distachyon]PNT70651.1 hypothetical protein BRADI_2g14990v3 [Brachypodium distachyon]
MFRFRFSGTNRRRSRSRSGAGDADPLSGAGLIGGSACTDSLKLFQPPPIRALKAPAPFWASHRSGAVEFGDSTAVMASPLTVALFGDRHSAKGRFLDRTGCGKRSCSSFGMAASAKRFKASQSVVVESPNESFKLANLVRSFTRARASLRRRELSVERREIRVDGREGRADKRDVRLDQRDIRAEKKEISLAASKDELDRLWDLYLDAVKKANSDKGKFSEEAEADKESDQGKFSEEAEADKESNKGKFSEEAEADKESTRGSFQKRQRPLRSPTRGSFQKRQRPIRSPRGRSTLTTLTTECFQKRQRRSAD